MRGVHFFWCLLFFSLNETVSSQTPFTKFNKFDQNQFNSNERLNISDVLVKDQTLHVTFGRPIGTDIFRPSRIGLAVMKNDTWSYFNNSNSQLPSTGINCIEVNNGTIWLGTSSGVYLNNGSGFQPDKEINDSLTDKKIVDIEFKNGKMFIATTQAVFIKDQSLTKYFQSSSTHDFTCIDISKDGIIYVGTMNGFYKVVDGSNFTKYDFSNSLLKAKIIHDIHVASDGRVWISGDVSHLPVPRDAMSSIFILENQGELKNLFDVISFNGCHALSTNTGFPSNAYSIQEAEDGSIIYLNYTNFFTLNQSNYTLNIIKDEELKSRTLNLPVSSYFYAYDQGEIYLVNSNDSGCYFDIFNHEILKERSSKYLDINELSLPVMPRHGLIGWDLELNSHLTFPPKSCKKLMFTSSLVVSGKVSGSSKKMSSVGTYGQRGYDFFAGPFDENFVGTTSERMQKFDKVWKMNRAQIDDFKLNYNSPNYKIPVDILSWPALGNDNINAELAPFVDVNNDGLYNAIDGDYPKIKGDMCLFWVVSDSINDLSNQGESLGNSMGIEVQCMAYGFNYSDSNESKEDDLINRTIFLSYKVVNKGSNNYENFRGGIFADGEIGNGSDDYIGCSLKDNFGFTYNGDSLDEGPFGYGNNPPILSIQVLNSEMASFMKWSNDNNPITGYPVSDSEFYNLMNSSWRNGLPLRWGDEKGVSSGPQINWMFPHDTILPNQIAWTESAIKNSPGERTMLLAGSGDTLRAGEFKTIDFAISVSTADRDTDWFDTLRKENQLIKHWYDNNSYPSSPNLDQLLNVSNTKDDWVSVYPNPTTGEFKLKLQEHSSGVLRIYSLQGQLIHSQDIEADESSIQLRSVPKGLYMVQVSTKNVNKLIKIILE